MDRKNSLLLMASGMLDHIIKQYSAGLETMSYASLEERVDRYRATYFRIEEEAIAQLNLVVIQDREDILSLRYDIDPLLQQKLQAFALKWNPVRDNLN